MSWLGRIFGRRPKVPLEQIAGVIGRILSKAANLGQYREELVRAAQRGDLDGPFLTFQRANERARDYIERG